MLGTGLMAIRAEAGTWYRGDLHAHSQYSDGDSPVSAVIARAEDAGLDFFVITDHDSSLGGVPAHWQDPDYASEGMLLLYGMEWTTGSGHANIWAAAPFDYEEIWQARLQNDPVAAAHAAHAAGALFSINHPSAYLCCPWEYEVPDSIDAVEVWNDMYLLPMFNHWAGHGFWDGLLSAGRRIPGVGGSDTHQLSGWQSWLFNIGNPTTWVYADELSGQAILAGIQAGHVTISYAPQAPRLEFSADIDNDGSYETMAGDAAGCVPGQAVTFKVRVADGQLLGAGAFGPACELDHALVEALARGIAGIDDAFNACETLPEGSDAPTYALGVFKNGRLLRAALVSSEDYTFTDAPEEESYYRVELIGRPDVGLLSGLLYGNMIALSNPIYVICGE
jgi:hypothetical protein